MNKSWTKAMVDIEAKHKEMGLSCKPDIDLGEGRKLWVFDGWNYEFFPSKDNDGPAITAVYIYGSDEDGHKLLIHVEYLYDGDIKYVNTVYADFIERNYKRLLIHPATHRLRIKGYAALCHLLSLNGKYGPNNRVRKKWRNYFNKINQRLKKLP